MPSIQGPPQWMRLSPARKAAAKTPTIAAPHRRRSHQARGHRPSRPDARLGVRPVDKIIVVIREVGPDLHEDGEGEAEAGGGGL